MSATLNILQQRVEKLDAWADDLKIGLEQEIKSLDKEIREVRRTAKVAPGLNEKLQLQKQQHALEKLRSKRRRELFDKQDEVDSRREELICGLEDRLEQKVNEEQLFSIFWEVI